MPELMDQMFCSQQIVIPPKFPYILKRYCKAAIKTQPYDLLRWSYEYFKALSQHRPPPVKLRLEYPVYSTEGGLTRGCLKVLAQQLAGMTEIPLPTLKAAWGGFCLDHYELKRIMCLCEVYMRAETVPFLYFVAVAGGMLTKSLTHTMILLCESLTKEPDGGSAAIPVDDFLAMYNFLASIDASKDVRYCNGYREGEEAPEPEASVEEEQAEEVDQGADDLNSEDLWSDGEWPGSFQKLSVINAHLANTTRLSLKMNKPALGKIERSPSMERASQIERENYQRESKGRASRSEDIDRKLRELSTLKMSSPDLQKDGEPQISNQTEDYEDEERTEIPLEEETLPEEGNKMDANSPENIALMVADLYQAREERLEDLERTVDEIAAIVDRFKSTNYDLGMVAGRQMSTTSGEFIVQHIEQQIMAYIDDQIAILPDPDLKRKKAKPEEVEMIRNLLETFIEENMDVIVPEIEEVEEEEVPIAEITTVYAVPGIGGPVDEDIMRDFEQYVLDICKLQADMFMPRNIRHYLCPPLEKYEECDYENAYKPDNEEVPTGGAITD